MSYASKIIAQGKIRKALALLEQAQGLLDQSAAEISSIVGVAREHRGICRIYFQVKKQWRVLNERMNARNYDMDGTWKRRIDGRVVYQSATEVT